MNDTVQQQLDGASQVSAATPAPLERIKPPKVRMDKSRTFATVHGERHPSDPLAKVHFIQDGVPADASGHFIFDHPMMEEEGEDGDMRRKAAARKLKRAMANAEKQRPVERKIASGDDDENESATGADDDEDNEDDELDPINLESWLRGEQEVEWQEVTQEIARRFKRRVAKIEDAVNFLVKEGVVPKAQLRKKFQKWAD